MSERVLVEVDTNGVSEFAHFDSEGNLIGLEHTDDVTDIIESNKALQNDGSKGYGATREWKRLASIPISLLRQWEMEGGLPRGFLETRAGFEVIIKKIKDPDYRDLRTA